MIRSQCCVFAREYCACDRHIRFAQGQRATRRPSWHRETTRCPATGIESAFDTSVQEGEPGTAWTGQAQGSAYQRYHVILVVDDRTRGGAESFEVELAVPQAP